MALAQLSRRMAARSIFRSAVGLPSAAAFSSGAYHNAAGSCHTSTYCFSGLEHISITFITPDEEEIKVSGAVGSTVLEVAHANKIEIEGACGGECACSTCHVIVDEDSFDKLPELELEEEDMLDLAAEVSDTSVPSHAAAALY